MWAPVMSAVVVGLSVGVVAPAQAAHDYVTVTGLVAKGRTVNARIAFHKPTIDRPGSDRLHLWLGTREDGQVATLWRSAKVALDEAGRTRVRVRLSAKKAAKMRAADRLILTATQRHREPAADLFTRNFVASITVPPAGGERKRGACADRVVGPDADLRDCDLTGAVLRAAELRGADLTGARLDQADLSGANLTSAYLAYNLSVAQAVNGKLDNQQDYGFLKFLSVTSNGQTIELPTNLALYNIGTRQAQQAVGALQTVAVGPAIVVQAALKSSPGLQALAAMPTGAKVRFGLTVYHWDPIAKAYFPAFDTGGALEATLKSTPVFAPAPTYGPPIDTVLQFAVVPVPGCDSYALQTAPGATSAADWGQGC